MNLKNKLPLVLMLSGAVSVLSGCTVGQSDFNCSSGDENALCASSRTIYRATDNELQENETITYIKDGEVHQTTLSELDSLKESISGERNSESDNRTISEKKSSVSHSNTGTQQVPFQFNYDGEVLRKDVKVLRIWVAPFVDKNDDLHLSTLLYTDIEKRKWEVGSIEPQTGLMSGVKPFLASGKKSVVPEAESSKPRKGKTKK
jgi:conjugal transfer pilus assembly protein TraV